MRDRDTGAADHVILWERDSLWTPSCASKTTLTQLQFSKRSWYKSRRWLVTGPEVRGGLVEGMAVTLYIGWPLLVALLSGLLHPFTYCHPPQRERGGGGWAGS
jgi:hypothetical protein